ncbi:MAG: fused MFS/spermidine synthase [Zavarzinia sp.]|nr:fused MFS/spermidine synthase [Zavarzinia sp.]
MSATSAATLLRGGALHAAAFFSGFVTMALEMMIGRTFIPYFGGTIYTWGALIAVFLIGMTIGYVVGGRYVDRHPHGRIVGLLFFLSTFTILVMPFWGDEIINRILDQVYDLRYAALLAAVALACLPAALLAAVGPFCLRLLLDARTHSGTISGRISALNTAGSILGTLGTSFYFIPSFGMRSIYFVLAGVTLFFSIAVYLLTRPRRGLATAEVAGLVVAIVTALVVPTGTPAQAQDTSALAPLPDGELERVDSEYNTIFVEKHGDVVGLYFGYRRMRYTESAISISKPRALIVPYTRTMTAALAFHAEPVKRIALVGLGGGRTINYLVQALPGAVADVAELDGAVVDLAARYFDTRESDRLHIHTVDGRIFLRRTQEKYDLVLLDAYRGPFVPFHLTTQEFYRLVQETLAPGGIVAQNVEPTTMFFDSAYATMKSVFDQVDMIPAHGNIVLVGYAGPRLSDEELAARAALVQARDQLPYDLRELVKARREVGTIDKPTILTDDFAPVESLHTIERHNEKRE